MDPEIRYLRTPDDVQIAYYEAGKGTPAVWLDMPYSHLQFEWRQDQAGPRVYQAVADQARLVRLDHRGFGLSDRKPGRYSLDAFVEDIECVVDRLNLPPFIMLATRGPTAPIAVAYAARHPDRLTDMVIFNAAAGIPADVAQRMHDMIEVARGDWRFASEGIARLALGWDDEAGSRAHAELLRESVDLDGFRRWLAEYSSWDICDLLPKVTTRTLLTNTRGDPWFGEEQGRDMASLMPDARCFISDAPTAEQRVIETSIAVAKFLGRVPEDAPVAPPSPLSSEQGTPLTDRETEVLRLLAAGLGNKAIAERLVVSVRTVETHVAHIYAKLGVASRAQATAAAINRGLVEP